MAQHLGLAILLPVRLLHMTAPVSTAAMTAVCPDSHHILQLSLPGSLGSTCNESGPAARCNVAPCTMGYTLVVATKHFWRCGGQHASLLNESSWMHAFIAVSASECNFPWPYSLDGATACCSQPCGARRADRSTLLYRPRMAVAGCRRRFLPTLPRQVILLRSSSAGVCRVPALLITYLAMTTSLKWRPPGAAVVSADTPTAWRLRWPAPAHFSIKILSA